MDCVICQLAFGPEEKNGVRRLKTFNGYTVDLRLQQFRKIPRGKLPQFIDFCDPKGQQLLAQMHERAIELAHAYIQRVQRRQKES